MFFFLFFLISYTYVNVLFFFSHSVDNVCIESMSVDITKRTLDNSTRSLNVLSNTIDEMKQTDYNRLQEEYNRLVQGLREVQTARETDVELANPILPDEVLAEAIPGSIRRAEHFVKFMKRFVEYLKVSIE